MAQVENISDDYGPIIVSIIRTKFTRNNKRYSIYLFDVDYYGDIIQILSCYLKFNPPKLPPNFIYEYHNWRKLPIGWYNATDDMINFSSSRKRIIHVTNNN